MHFHLKFIHLHNTVLLITEVKCEWPDSLQAHRQTTVTTLDNCGEQRSITEHTKHRIKTTHGSARVNQEQEPEGLRSPEKDRLENCKSQFSHLKLRRCS